jgi:hypothetical protein
LVVTVKGAMIPKFFCLQSLQCRISPAICSANVLFVL